jgi:hypothetical protein
MEKVNIPIYRAKIDIETLARGNNIEEYLYRVIRHYVNRGIIIKNEDNYYAIGRLNSYDEIEVFDSEDKQILKYPYFETTLAVHFPNNNMLDSEETPIFASLDKEKGRGGDICTYNYLLCKYTMIFNPIIGVKAINLLDYDDNGYILNPRLTVIGIQK